MGLGRRDRMVSERASRDWLCKAGEGDPNSQGGAELWEKVLSWLGFVLHVSYLLSKELLPLIPIGKSLFQTRKATTTTTTKEIIFMSHMKLF